MTGTRDAAEPASAPDAARDAAPDVARPTLLGGVLAVAALAFRESARSRVLHALLAATLVTAAVSHVFAYVSGDDPVRRHKVMVDLCLSAITMLSTVAAIFLGTNLIYQEVERRTIYTVLARPLGRGQLVVGKYLGLLAVLLVAMLGMSVGVLAIFALGGGRPTAAIGVAIALTYVEVAVVAAVAIFFSVAAHPIEGAVFAFVVALAGHVTASLNDLAARLGSALVQKALYATYVLLPNLENFNLRPHAAHGLPIDAGAVLGATAYGALYSAIVLALATLVFRRRVL